MARNIEDTRLTRVGHVVGTLAYMSPEALKAGDVDGRTDVYAVGILLFEMLTGRPPYRGTTANAYLTASKTGISEEDRDLLSPMMVELLDQMLRADLRRRPYASELTTEMVAISQGESWLQPDAGSSAPLPEVQRPPVVSAWSRVVTWVSIGVAFGGGVAVGRGTAPSLSPSVPLLPAASSVASFTPDSVPRFESAGAALLFGVGALDRGQYPSAVKALEQAVDHNPALAIAHRRLGDALLAQRKFEEAASSYKMFLTLKPDTPDAEVLRALLNDLSSPKVGLPPPR
ncbi:MAG: tetratricopeptide repeat protein [Myxococcota bacterium]